MGLAAAAKTAGDGEEQQESGGNRQALRADGHHTEVGDPEDRGQDRKQGAKAVRAAHNTALHSVTFLAHEAPLSRFSIDRRA